MASRQITEFVNGTGDAAFAINESGMISAWNKAAEELFGLSAADAIGLACHEVMKGANEGGAICSEDCAIQRALKANDPVPNFDARVQTAAGRQWTNISILMVTESGSGARHAIHIVRLIEWRKRLEQLARDFVVRETELERTKDGASAAAREKRLINVKLTQREKEVLQALANDPKTDSIAESLGISRSTVRNHVKHIMVKLDAHNRSEVLRRARHEGLV